jgi:putative IMPACT (imprinted ancient) family translation regulator
VASKADVEVMLSVLLRNGKVARATHNMSAYRIRVPEKGTFLQDCDDDGEDAAGSRLLHLLQVGALQRLVPV